MKSVKEVTRSQEQEPLIISRGFVKSIKYSNARFK